MAYRYEDLLRKLGPGRHFGEWYGQGIQRGYGLDHKRFILFPSKLNPRQVECEIGLETVPVLYKGMFDEGMIRQCLNELMLCGSVAVKGYMKPEGIVIYHTASGHCYKVTVEGDEKPKGVKDGDNYQV